MLADSTLGFALKSISALPIYGPLLPPSCGSSTVTDPLILRAKCPRPLGSVFDAYDRDSGGEEQDGYTLWLCSDHL